VRLLPSLVSSLSNNAFVRCAAQNLKRQFVKFPKHLHHQIWGIR